MTTWFTPDEIQAQMLRDLEEVTKERDALKIEVERLRAVTERPAVRHLNGAHLNQRADDCVLCATMDERDTLRASMKSVAERQRKKDERSVEAYATQYEEQFGRSNVSDGLFRCCKEVRDTALVTEAK